jgi:hypothetical protein
MTLDGDTVAPTPVFLGANPARVEHAGHVVSRPLAPEEDLARALLAEIGPAGRAAAVVADGRRRHPQRSAGRRRHGHRSRRRRGGRSGAGGARPAGAAVGVYLSRLDGDLAAAETARIEPDRLHFAWEGSTQPGGPHYYRIQAPALLIEYDNRDNDANHAHTVLRRPGRLGDDFGDDVLLATGATTDGRRRLRTERAHEVARCSA